MSGDDNPLDRAQAALAAAREARGVSEEDELPEVPPLDLSNPLAAAEAALARAKAAREQAQGPKKLEAEARARKELARLKEIVGAAGPTEDPPDNESSDEDEVTDRLPRRDL